MIIYDTEILKAIPPFKKKDRLPDISYCKGWTDFKNMGIACIGAHLSDVGYIIFEEKEVFYYDYDGESFVLLFEVSIEDSPNFSTGFDFFVEQVNQEKSRDEKLIGFNSISFDDKLLKASGYEIDTDIDLLCEVRLSTNQPPFYDPTLTKGGYSLNDLAIANKLGNKSMTGAIAPIEWQKGNKEAVRQYCLRDVYITRELFLADQLIDPTNKNLIQINKEGRKYQDFVFEF
jgi:hypothetical protein